MYRNKEENQNFLCWKKAAILILGLMLMSSLVAAAGDRFEQKLERVENLTSDGKVMINNISGDIKIFVWKEGKVKIEAVKRAEAKDEAQAKKAMEAVEIQIKAEPGLLVVKTQYPENKGFFGKDSSVSVDYTLWIPDRASVEARSISGDILIREAGGQVIANTVSGDVEISGGKKSVEAKAVSGDIRVEKIEDDAQLSSVSGDIYATGIKGSVEAEAVSGSIHLKDISQAKSVSAKSVSGSIDYRGDVMSDGRYQFNSHSGNVVLVLPASSSFELEAGAFSGTVKTEFPIEIIGEISDKQIKGKVGKGGAYIVAKTFSGRVEIRKA
ncbi:MAG TPA: DUF4097 family beta strand repeat-containing protein [Candidatus Saccharicenans sp.]|nr:DUF4097 family beta strand repeat-containing protein [Candidatus Saccharicenans sp.]HQO76589.1 DUF4097 family beta strand repeat-containing protein [Candidatus Saccharicenans sp.]HUM79805.1 DUF4097 family beta strand repeat-containing protein [Candidatus Saccharicenans sp.]